MDIFSCTVKLLAVQMYVEHLFKLSPLKSSALKQLSGPPLLVGKRWR